MLGNGLSHRVARSQARSSEKGLPADHEEALHHTFRLIWLQTGQLVLSLVDGMIARGMLGAAHDSLATAVPVCSRKSTRMECLP